MNCGIRWMGFGTVQNANRRDVEGPNDDRKDLWKIGGHWTRPANRIDPGTYDRLD